MKRIPHQSCPALFTYLALALAMIFWGFSFIATKVALASFTPFCLIFFRFAVAAIFFVWLLNRTGFPELNRPNLKMLALLAIFQPGLYFTFETIGLQYTTATKTSLIIATIPIVVLLLSVLFLKERLRRVNTIGICISMIGVCLLVFGETTGGTSGGALIGDLMICGAVLSAAVYMIITRHLGQSVTPVQITGMQIIFGAIIFFPAFLYDLPKVSWGEIRYEGIIALAALTVFATIGAFLCYNYALSRIPAARAAVCINGIPVVTAFGAWILLGESLAPLQLAGGGIVLAAVYLANYSNQNHEPEALQDVLQES
ncbi:DMT family transporter [Desulfosediminicola sp.]|uniref:DMT family transporter n=1 Tax=Desulfosediminicola sp. TaxID=2886825 RepID=UPI003AF21944